MASGEHGEHGEYTVTTTFPTNLFHLLQVVIVLAQVVKFFLALVESVAHDVAPCGMTSSHRRVVPFANALLHPCNALAHLTLLFHHYRFKGGSNKVGLAQCHATHGARLGTTREYPANAALAPARMVRVTARTNHESTPHAPYILW